jgi:hypothetical protein
MTRVEAVEQLKRVFATLNSDLEASLQLGRADPSQFAHRTLIRTYFAFVEGIAYQLRKVTLATLHGTELLSPAEAALLREERFQLNSKGEPETKENFQSVLPNLLFSIRCYVKNHGATYAPDTGVVGWELMRKAVAVRDRITHPKSVEGLEITDDDVNHFVAAAGWWKQTLLQMFQACGEADEFFRAQGKKP